MDNIERIKKALSGQKFKAMLITDPANRFFATGFQSSAGALLVTERGAWFYTDSRYIEAAGSAITNANVLQMTDEAPYSEQIHALLLEYGIDAVGFEERSVSYSEYLEWRKKLKVKLIRAHKLLSDLRMIKSADDLNTMKTAQRIAEKSFEEVLHLVNTDITEKELAAELLYRFLKNGADDKSFDIIVVSGVRSSLPHGVPDDVNIGKGFLTIDFGVRLNGWCSDTTRTVCVGKPDDEMTRVYDTVLEAQEAGIKAVRAGVAGSAVDAQARTVIEDAGFGEYFGHGFGHGIGIEVHEAPRAAKTSEDVLPEGAVISAEPGIYLPHRYGVRIEDALYITGKGCENMTNLTKKLIIL